MVNLTPDSRRNVEMKQMKGGGAQKQRFGGPKTYLRISSMAVAPAIEEREKREHQRSSETEKS